MTIRPLGKKILVRVVTTAGKETMSDGIIIAAGVKRDGHREVIVQALPARYKGELVPGDRVFMKPFSGTEVKINGELLVFCNESDELEAVLE